MEGIVWTKFEFHSGKTVSYKAKVGCMELWCRPSKTTLGNKPRILGWMCSVYFGEHDWPCKVFGHTKREIPLELAQKEGEKLAIKYLLGHGLTIVRALKRTSLLEDVLSEVGIDL